MIGRVFGMLKVVAEGPVKTRNISWLCLCECGNTAVVRGDSLRGHGTVSCGCYHRSRAVTHGMSKSLIYKLWSSVLDRCFNPRCNVYKYYGGRGITVCESWLEFQNFYNDMGLRPHGKSLERINNELGYSKDNCKWATPFEQANNKRGNIYIECNGERRTISQWSAVTGLSYRNIQNRIYTLKWDVSRALTAPVQG